MGGKRSSGSVFQLGLAWLEAHGEKLVPHAKSALSSIDQKENINNN
jgi:hypothetical protein